MRKNSIDFMLDFCTPCHWWKISNDTSYASLMRDWSKGHWRSVVCSASATTLIKKLLHFPHCLLMFITFRWSAFWNLLISDRANCKLTWSRKVVSEQTHPTMCYLPKSFTITIFSIFMHNVSLCLKFGNFVFCEWREDFATVATTRISGQP